MQLERAHLNYGSQTFQVEPSSSLPLPTTFDFDNPIECAKLALACMSNASGGFTQHNCKVKINHERQMATITSHGCMVFYAPKDRPKLSITELIELEKKSTTINLGNVTTNQYGNGWQEAKWWTGPSPD